MVDSNCDANCRRHLLDHRSERGLVTTQCTEARSSSHIVFSATVSASPHFKPSLRHRDASCSLGDCERSGFVLCVGDSQLINIDAQNRSIPNRKISIAEFLAYVTLCSITLACFLVPEPNVYSTLVVIFLPGILSIGPIGFLIGGRRWILPFSAVGTILWWILCFIPFLMVARE